MRTFLFGLLLGAVAGVLYAPATGNRTRSLLKDKMNRLSNETADLLESKGKDLSNRVEGVKHNVNKALEQAKPRLEQAKGAVQTTYEKMRADAAELKQNMQETIDEARNEIKSDRQQRSA